MKLPILLLLSSIIFSCFAADSDAPPPLSIGSKAPPFNLPGVDGKNYSLDSFKDSKILTVIFTCNHCPTAQAYEDRIKKLVDAFKPRGVAFVAISPNDATNGVRPDELGYTDLGDTLEEMKIRSDYKQFNFPYLFGGGELEPMSRAYGPVVTPHVFVFDQERRLQYAGRIDDAERLNLVKNHDLEQALNAMLKGEKPAVAQTKVFGCSTKWSAKGGEVGKYWAKVHAEPVNLTPVSPEELLELKLNKTAADGEGKLRLINFWATWCGPCVTEFPDLINMNLCYRQRGLEVITVAAQYPDEKEGVLRFLKRNHASTRNLIFKETDKYKYIESFDPKWDGALPYTILINAQGKILYRKQGSFDNLELRRTILKELDVVAPWKG